MAATEERGAWPVMKVLPIVILLLVAATIFAPLMAVLAIPGLIVLVVYHTLAMARTAGSIIPFAILLGIDILLLVLVLGAVLSQL